MSGSRAVKSRALLASVVLLCALSFPAAVNGDVGSQCLTESSSQPPDCGAAPVSVAVWTEYPDVPPDHWAYRQIMACSSNDVVQGYPDGLYHPELVVDRGSMSAFIARAMVGGEGQVPAPASPPEFGDVQAESWAWSYVQMLAGLNLVTGYPDGEYHPEEPVDRGQMAVFIARAAIYPPGEEGLAAFTPPESPTFSDVPPDSWCFKHVEFLAWQTVIAGYPDGTYRPEEMVTRDQMAVYVARGFGID
ncbi:MAG: S-layer homology domain-containing protein [Armatimonadota bacterium]